MNILEIFGHLGADPETRMTPNGTKLTVLRVATRIRRSGKDETIWWRVTVWGTQFDKMISYLKKGSAVIVVGEMGKPEIYTDKMGVQQVSLQMTAEFLRFSPFGKPERTEQSHQSSYSSPSPSQQQAPQSFAESSGDFSSYGTASEEVFAGVEEDSIPF